MGDARRKGIKETAALAYDGVRSAPPFECCAPRCERTRVARSRRRRDATRRHCAWLGDVDRRQRVRVASSYLRVGLVSRHAAVGPQRSADAGLHAHRRGRHLADRAEAPAGGTLRNLLDQRDPRERRTAVARRAGTVRWQSESCSEARVSGCVEPERLVACSRDRRPRGEVLRTSPPSRRRESSTRSGREVYVMAAAADRRLVVHRSPIGKRAFALAGHKRLILLCASRRGGNTSFRTHG